MRELENEKIGKWGVGLCQGNEAAPCKKIEHKKRKCSDEKNDKPPPLFTYSAIVVYLLSCEFLLTLS